MGSKARYRNVLGLSQAKLDELLKILEKLDDFGGDLLDRVVRYVLDGEDEAVLGELAGRAEAAVRVRLFAATGFGPGGQKSPWGEFFQSIEPVDCRFYLRLAKVFEAGAPETG